MRIRVLTSLSVAALILAACGSADDASSAGDGSASGDHSTALDGDWFAVDGVSDGADVELIDGRGVTLSIEGDRVSGTAACNGYGGAVTSGVDGALAVSELGWTEMGCEPAVQLLEQTFLASLAQFANYSLEADTLILSGDDDTWTFERLLPIEDSAIIATTWVLDTYIDGGAASNTTAMESVTLTLHDDGRIAGSTSCRPLDGTWTGSGMSVRFTTFRAIDDPAAGQCAPDSAELDRQIMSVLDGGFTATVEGDRLTLMTESGEGLSYTADP